MARDAAGTADDFPTASSGLAWAGLAVLVGTLVARATAMHTPFPYWDLSAFEFDTPVAAWTPVGTLWLDVLAMLGAALAVAGARGVRPRAAIGAAALASVGLGVVLWHGGELLDQAQTGVSWAAAVSAGIGAWALAHERRLRAILAAAVLGLACVVAARGVVQVSIEHAQTVRQFEVDREAFFRARGWTEGSTQAQLYERRLRQPEATAWFGLSNVTATVAAAGTVGFGVLAIGLLRTRRSAAVCAGLAAVASGVGLWLTHSKGGYGALLVGVAAAAMLGWAGRGRLNTVAAGERGSPRLGGIVALALVASALAAVVVRGMVGERLGELSLLFRWFYMEGAARIVAEHPRVGVGPAGFRDAYLLAKPALSPEEVTSPHSVVLDWVATLGVLGGGAWLVLLACAVWRAGRGTGRTLARASGSREESHESVITVLKVLAGLVVIGVVVATRVEAEITTIEVALARLGGIGLCVLGGWAVLVAAWERPRTFTLAVASAAIAAAWHGQIEMTPVQPGSGVWWAMLVGIAAAGMGTPREGGAGTRWVAAALLGAGAATTVGLVAGPMGRWEADLRRAAEAAWPIAAARAEGSAVSLAEVRLAHETAAGALLAAGRERPGHLDTRIAATRTALDLAQLTGDRTLTGAGLGLAIEGTAVGPERAGSWMWLGTVAAGLAEAEGGAGAAELRGQAASAWERAAALNPGDPGVAVRLADLAARDGDGAAAARWASEAIRRDGLMRLDPLRRLAGEDADRMRSLAGGGP